MLDREVRVSHGLPCHARTSGMRLPGTSDEVRSFRSEMLHAGLPAGGLGLRACFAETGLPVEAAQAGPATTFAKVEFLSGLPE